MDVDEVMTTAIITKAARDGKGKKWIKNALKKESNRIASLKCRERKKQMDRVHAELLKNAVKLGESVPAAEGVPEMGALAAGNESFLRSIADSVSDDVLSAVRNRLSFCAQQNDMLTLQLRRTLDGVRELTQIANTMPEHNVAEENRPEAAANLRSRGLDVPDECVSQPRGRPAKRVGNRSTAQSGRHTTKRRHTNADGDSDDGDNSDDTDDTYYPGRISQGVEKANRSTRSTPNVDGFLVDCRTLGSAVNVLDEDETY